VRNKHSAEPSLTAIVIVPDTYDSVRLLMTHLQTQTAVEQIEIIFVAPSRQQLRVDESEMTCFHSWHVVEVGKVVSIARGYAAGIRQAHASIIALTQDHAFPDTKWAELLIAAHEKGWAAVGLKMSNGNPSTMISQADFYISYGEWAHPASSGKVRHLPGHNSSYKRDVLLKYESELEDLMEAESVFHRRLNAQGYELMLEAGTYTRHLNHAKWAGWIPKRYYQGRQFASTWAKSWSWSHKLLFIALSPLIPWVRLWRVQKHVRRGQTPGFFICLLPALIAGLLAEGCGHFIGYVAGIGDCVERTTKYEFDRIKQTKLE
jgi:hypothetical protein